MVWARITGEFFREPDPQLGFLWGGLTMGMLLSAPMVIAGVTIIVVAWRRNISPKHEKGSPRREHVVTEYSPLQSEIKRLIKTSGPMPVWCYMELCLTHPKHGYYVSRDPLGREGDFTTAPEVSQMFGELLGLWAASVWKAIGSPSSAAAGRTRTRPRHHDGGCDAGAAGIAAALSVAERPSRRDQPGAARKAEGDAVGRAQPRLA